MQLNSEIREKEVYVVDENGVKLGVMDTREALRVAGERSLDLMKVSDSGRAPVCRFVDYGRFCFERSKKEKEMKKRQHISEVKEIRLSVNTGSGDLETKARHAREFLQEGNKVKVWIRFRGREQAHPEIAHQMMRKFYGLCSDYALIQNEPSGDGRYVTMILGTNAKKSAARPAGVSPEGVEDTTTKIEKEDI
ncbi:MAG: translation initiation factor IF-3 [Oscillospiraceae bacterium]|nr:translation initiation factor IF-3 [Oscillospiraceae bacterium]